MKWPRFETLSTVKDTCDSTICRFKKKLTINS